MEHPFQINIIVLNKCTFTPWQAYQTSASQKQAIEAIPLRAMGREMMEQVDCTRKKGRNREDTRHSAEDTSDLALFAVMTQKTSKPNDSAPTL